MKLTITLQGTEDSVTLPIHHNHFIQSAIYQLLDPVYAAFLHEKGYTYEKRHFRLFSFSRLLGQYSLEPKVGTITFVGPMELVVLTPLKPVSEGIVNSLIMGKEFRIGARVLTGTAVKIDYPTVSSDTVAVRTLSPIVSYSTLMRADGRKFTYYFDPTESEFGRLVADNLYKKLKAWTPDIAVSREDFRFSIRPLKPAQKRVVIYKGTVIKGYSGYYLLEGEPEYLEFALNVGLGAKGAQGFGAIEQV